MRNDGHDSALDTALVDEVRAALDGCPPAVLLALGDDPELARRAYLRLTGELGALVPQDRRGTLVREIRQRDDVPAGGPRRYSESASGGDFHTDGVMMPAEVPDTVGLLMMQPSAEGGSTVLVDSRLVIERLERERPDVLARLQHPFHFDRRGTAGPGEARTVSRPIVRPGDPPTIHYLRSYIDAAHQEPGVPPLDASARAALDVLDELIEDPDTHAVVDLAIGEALLFDNNRYLHGRTAFVDDEHRRRRLMRVWLRRTRS